MALVGFNKPKETLGKDSYDYLCKQNEWLTYMFSNIDEENLSESFSQAVKTASETGAAAIETAQQMILLVANVRREISAASARIEELESYINAMTITISVMDERITALEAQQTEV